MTMELFSKVTELDGRLGKCAKMQRIVDSLGNFDSATIQVVSKGDIVNSEMGIPEEILQVLSEALENYRQRLLREIELLHEEEPKIAEEVQGEESRIIKYENRW